VKTGEEEEEEEPERDAEALDVLARRQEGLKFQPLEKAAELVTAMKTTGTSW
jgi:hypothetical protein